MVLIDMTKSDGMANISIKSFEKIGCAKAKVYDCKYRVGISEGNLTESLFGNIEQINIRRFIKPEQVGRWLINLWQCFNVTGQNGLQQLFH